jgi:hypothetical protein
MGGSSSPTANPWFADSPLEQAGEPSVPVREKSFWELPYLSCGTPLLWRAARNRPAGR